MSDPLVNAVGVFLRLVDASASVVPQIYRAIRDRKRGAELDEDWRAVLGIHGKERVAAFRSGALHPLYTPENIHPDNLDAVRAVYDGEVAERLDVEIVADLSAPLTDNMVLFGSPVSEGLSRLIFGYEPGRVEGAFRYENPVLDFPFHWILDDDVVASGPRARRLVRNRGWTERPNWGVRDGSTERYPTTGNDGTLQDDLLVVTHLKNFIRHEAEVAGHWITHFGGAHGTATAGSELLMRDRDIRRRIDRAVGGLDRPFQALIKVSSLSHDTDRGTRGSRLTLVAAEPLEASPAGLALARDVFWRNVERQPDPGRWMSWYGNKAP